MLFDTHAHLDDKAFDEDRNLIIDSLQKNDVKKVVNVGASIESSLTSIDLANRYDFIYAAVGIHPHDVSNADESDFAKLEEMTRNKKVLAIGEIGLDYYYDHSPREVQKEWFAKQIQLAEKLDLPYIVHSRDATKDTFDIIKENTRESKFVLHCYSQSKEMVTRYVDLGAYISFAGTLTFKNAVNLKEAIRAVPLDRLLIETDSPYLSPVPMRGKRNNPTNVKYVAEEAARLLSLSYEEVCKITYQNAIKFFNIKED